MNSHSEHSEKPKDGNGDSLRQSAATPIHRDSQPNDPGRGMGWKLAVAVVILAIALGGGFFYVHSERATQEANLADQTGQTAGESATVDIIHVKPAPSSLPLVLPGETRGWYQSTIYARVNGYVGNWTADIGDVVHKGQVLATIETPDLDAQLDAAQQQFAVAQSDVGVAQANRDFAYTTFRRWFDSPKGDVAQQETDEKKAAFDSNVAQLKAVQAKVSAAAAEVNRLKALEEYKKVTSPFDGIITDRRIDIGNLVTAGSTSNTSPLYSIAQYNVIRVFADVPQENVGQIAVGMETQCTSKSFPGRVFDGKVARTSQAIDLQTRTLKVEVDITNPDFALLPGMYMLVSFGVRNSSLVEVPASAMLFRSGGHQQVAVVGDDGKVSFHDVTIAVDNGDKVDISSGLSTGDKVALNISSQISDGDHVNAVDTEKVADSSPAPTVTAATAVDPH